MGGSVIWAPSLAQVNEVLTFVSLVGGLILIAIRVGKAINTKKVDDEGI
jgi:hypothetical protein